MPRKVLQPKGLWDPRPRFAQIVRSGNLLFIAGQTAVDGNGNVVGKGDTRGAFPDYRDTVQNVIASGDLVATKTLITGTMTGALRGPKGTLPSTGKRLEVPCATFFRIAEGKIVEIWGYYDSIHFLKALGVLPSPPPK